MIDRSLNYGRHHVEYFLKTAGDYSLVLDLGAGHGDDLLLAREINSAAKLHAIERHPLYTRQLTDKCMTVHSLNVEKDRLPFADGSVDLVIANQLLEHVKEIFWLFHEVSRVLPVGGKLILGVPNLASLHNRLLLAIGQQPTPLKNNSAHIRGFTKGDVIKVLDSCFPGGYELRRFRGSNFYPFPPLLADPLSRLFPSLAWSIFFLFEKKRAYGKEFLEFPQKERRISLLVEAFFELFRAEPSSRIGQLSAFYPFKKSSFRV
jgi:SAM-dependent methyltransferase